MKFPLQITYRDMDASDGLDGEIRKRAQQLDKHSDRITRCRVIIEAPSQHHRQGSYKVRIELSVPGQELVANRDSGDHTHEHSDAYAAVRDAFAAIERELRTYADRRLSERQRPDRVSRS